MLKIATFACLGTRGRICTIYIYYNINISYVFLNFLRRRALHSVADLPLATWVRGYISPASYYSELGI